MDQTIKTAIILAAGRGSRRMPITRAIDKAMLPIGNRPTVDYVVEQCIQAGVQRLVFIVGSPDTQLKKYYGDAFQSKDDYPWLDIDRTITCAYVVQDADGRYGTAAAVSYARPHVDDEVFVVLPADGFIDSAAPILRSLVENYRDNESCHGTIGGLKVPGAEAAHYSVIGHDAQYRLTELLEKPVDLVQDGMYLSNVSYYVLHRSIFDHIDALSPTGGEYYLTDAVVAMAKTQPVIVMPVDGIYIDSGQLVPWLRANQRLLDGADMAIS